MLRRLCNRALQRSITTFPSAALEVIGGRPALDVEAMTAEAWVSQQEQHRIKGRWETAVLAIGRPMGLGRFFIFRK
jgi:hypothetical protein